MNWAKHNTTFSNTKDCSDSRNINDLVNYLNIFCDDDDSTEDSVYHKLPETSERIVEPKRVGTGSEDSHGLTEHRSHFPTDFFKRKVSFLYVVVKFSYSDTYLLTMYLTLLHTLYTV